MYKCNVHVRTYKYIHDMTWRGGVTGRGIPEGQSASYPIPITTVQKAEQGK